MAGIYMYMYMYMYMIKEVSSFRTLLCTLFNVAGTTGRVLIGERGVLILVVLNREVPLYRCAGWPEQALHGMVPLRFEIDCER